MQHVWLAGLLALFTWSWTIGVWALGCDPWVARLESGQLEYSLAGETRWQTVARGHTFCPGDRVRVGAHQRAALWFINQTLVRMDEGTELTLTRITPTETSWLEMLRGALHILSRVPHSLEVNTPFVNANIEGTEFVLKVRTAQTDLWVYEGRVRYYNPFGSLAITPGQAAVAERGKAPRRVLVVRPRDAVQWALYYPPLIDYHGLRVHGPSAEVYRRALRYYRQDELPLALQVLDKLPEQQRDQHYYVLHAGLLLSVGRVREAEGDLRQTLRLQPENGVAHALLAIIALVNNDKEQAYTLAQQARREAPNSPVPYIALSYVEQARFKLEDALSYAQKAVALTADDALAQSRLAELWLMHGEVEQALTVARRAVELDPELSRTQSVLGFAHLAQIATDKARESFVKAIALDSADPLPRLGLGLAKIRQGELEPGRHEIEIAAGLDPNDALIRSYLGKAYYEERRNPLALNQYAMAKELDPRDPTPYLYDAIAKQSVNRPVEALQALQRSKALNDNRAVYRSKLLLDQDLAARGAALGRIYNELGFEQRALVEGWQAVNTDPSDYTAHRMLADNYTILPRHEIARVSELLQSQLLQPINITPVQPQLAETNLLVLPGSGPSQTSPNEFNPLFLRNRTSLWTSGVIGSQHTYGDEAVLAGVHNHSSYSVGQFHYETEGFNKNQDLRYDIYNLFLQSNITPDLSMQAELRSKAFACGDLALNFDRSTDPFLRLKDESNSVRLGLRQSFSPHAHLLVSSIYQNLDSNINDETLPTRARPFKLETSNTHGYLVEAQYLYKTELLSLNAGVGHFNTTARKNVPFTILDPRIRQFQTLDNEHSNAYLYTQFHLHPSLSLILGLSADFLSRNRLLQQPTVLPFEVNKSTHQLNPKTGLIWTPMPGTTLRAAFFRTLKRSLLEQRTLEPTQVAGFNQFYNDPEASDAWRFGVGLDQQLSAGLFAGFEYSKRQLETSVGLLTSNRTGIDELNFYRDETLSRAYLYWLPHPWLSISAEYQLESMKIKWHDSGNTTSLQRERTTMRIPLSLHFYHPTGVNLGLRATYFEQFGDFTAPTNPTACTRELMSLFSSCRTEFWILDFSMAYRLPHRYGIVGLEIRNLLNEPVHFEGTDPQPIENRGIENIPLIPLVAPDRSIFAKFTLAF